MSQDDIFINGELLRLRREASGWLLNDLATRACMSVKQIRQLEEGGMSSFYSSAVKMTAAKKVGALLGLSAQEVFAQVVELEPEPESEPLALDSEIVVAETEVSDPNDKLMATVSLHQDNPHTELKMATPAAVESVVEKSKSKTSLWVIAGLFAAALAVAAYFQPQDEPVVEAAPPIQALPEDLADPASAASSAEVTASSAEAVMLPASAASAMSPVIATRPASAIGSTSAASAASKAP
jgi:transcriptional regulator with XRE-family HTH domain